MPGPGVLGPGLLRGPALVDRPGALWLACAALLPFTSHSSLHPPAAPAPAPPPTVVFGKVTEGLSVVKKMESLGSRSGRTAQRIAIADCGEVGRRGAAQRGAAQRAAQPPARWALCLPFGPRALRA